MVLSACSPYFQAMFLNHPEKHPIVILKDVPFSDMKSLLDFMYRGEVSVDQERLAAFLKVAESLRIKGLTEVNDDKPTTAVGSNNTTNHNTPPPPPQLHRINKYVVCVWKKTVCKKSSEAIIWNVCIFFCFATVRRYQCRNGNEGGRGNCRAAQTARGTTLTNTSPGTMPFRWDLRRLIFFCDWKFNF